MLDSNMQCYVLLLSGLLAVTVHAAGNLPLVAVSDEHTPTANRGSSSPASTKTTTEERIRNVRTFFDPVAASLFAHHHNHTTSTFEKRSLTVRNLATNVTGNVALQDATSMYYAPSDFRRGCGQQYARLDVQGDRDNHTKVLSTEEFSDVIEKAECHEEGKIQLTFPAEMEFRQVQEGWQWINDGDDHTLVLITENEHCDRNNTDGTPRQPWLVTKAVFDDQQNQVELTAEAVSFEKAFGKNWHLKIERDTQSVGARERDRRGAHLAHISLDQDFSGVGINLPRSLSPLSIVTNDVPTGTLTCESCYTKGQLDFDIDISGLDGGRIHIVARHLESSLTMRLEVYQALADKKTNDYEIWGYVPPYTGIYIKGIVDIGPTMKFIVSTGFSTPVKEDVVLALGYKMSMSEPLDFTWDLLKPTAAKLTGFTPKFEMLPPGISEDVHIEGRIGPKLELSLDWSVLGQGAKVGLQFSAATLSLNVSSDKRRPACGGKGRNAVALPSLASDEGRNDNDNTTISGVNFDLNLHQEILASQSMGLLGIGASDVQKLASTTHDLASACIPITGVTTLTPRAATSSVHSYIPHTGNLADLAKEQLELVAEEVASAFKEKGGEMAKLFTEGVVAPKATEAWATVTSDVVSGVKAVGTGAGSAVGAVASVGEGVVDGVEEVGHAVKCLIKFLC